MHGGGYPSAAVAGSEVERHDMPTISRGVVPVDALPIETAARRDLECPKWKGTTPQLIAKSFAPQNLLNQGALSIEKILLNIR